MHIYIGPLFLGVQLHQHDDSRIDYAIAVLAENNYLAPYDVLKQEIADKFYNLSRGPTGKQKRQEARSLMLITPTSSTSGGSGSSICNAKRRKLNKRGGGGSGTSADSGINVVDEDTSYDDRLPEHLERKHDSPGMCIYNILLLLLCYDWVLIWCNLVYCICVVQ